MAELVKIHEFAKDVKKSWGDIATLLDNTFASKVGGFRFNRPDGENFYYLLVFKSEEDAQKWEDGEDIKPLDRRQLPISAVQSDSYSAQLSSNKTGSTIDKPFIIKRGETWEVKLRLNAWHIIAANSQRDPISSTATVYIERSQDGQSWTSVDQRSITTTDSTTEFPTTIDLGSILDTGVDGQYQVRFRVSAIPYTNSEGEESTMSAQAVVLHIKTVTLGIMLPDSEWQRVQEVSTNAQSLNPLEFVLSGAVQKTVHIQISDHEGEFNYSTTASTTQVGTYQVTPYDSSGTSAITTSGVHEIQAWVTCSNNEGGELVSDKIIHQIMVVNKGQIDSALIPRVLIQGLQQSVDNFVKSTICNYFVWEPELVNGAVINNTEKKSQVRFIVSDSIELDAKHEEYLSVPVSVQRGAKMSLDGTLEVETDSVSDEYSAYLHCVSENGNSLLQRVLFLTVDNTGGFQPISGAVFLLNPKTRNNDEVDSKTIINAKNGAIIQSEWSGFKMDSTDGYITDEYGEKVLRIPAGRLLKFDYNPFDHIYNQPALNKEVSIDIIFRMKNVVNEIDPVLRLAEFQDSINAWLGLMLKPLDGTMVSVKSGGAPGETDFRWAEDRKQHLTITVNYQVRPNHSNDIQYNSRDAANANGTLNLVRVYINGNINREIQYTPANPTEFRPSQLTNKGFVIGQEGSEGRVSGCVIDIHSVRVYEKGLNPTQVLQNVVSGVSDVAEKRRLKDKNDILRDDNTGRLDLKKVKQKGLNALIWHGKMPLIDDDKKKGWWEIHRYSLEGVYLPEYSGTICKETKSLSCKGQGTTAMTYYFWNMQTKLGDVEELIELTPNKIHSSIVLGKPFQKDGAWKVSVYGGNLGKDFPVGNGTKDYDCTVDASGSLVTVFFPDGWVDGNGLYRGMCWQNGPNRPLASKLVLKINYASAMQSHLPGTTWLFNELHTTFCGENSLQAGTPAEYKACVAKQTEPMLLFTAGVDTVAVDDIEGEAVYQGPGAFGPGKMDKPTWGYSSKVSAHDDFAMLEGSANNTILSDFLAPWDDEDHVLQDGTVQEAKVKYFLKDPVNASAKDPEAFHYRHTSLKNDNGVIKEEIFWEKGIGFDGGKTDDDGNPAKGIVEIFKAAYNFVYLHNPNINLYRGTFTEFQEDSSISDWQKKQKWVCRANADDESNYLVKRYDFCERRWVDAGLWNDSTRSYDKIDIRLYPGMDWDSMSAQQKANHAEVLAKYKELLIADAVANVDKYFKTSSLKFHYVFINCFMGGTDNCSKNTYYEIDPVTKKIELNQDDVDTIMATNNFGYQTKPYYIDRMHPFPDGSDISEYDGMQNGLFDLIEAMWGNDESQSLAQAMGAMLNILATLTGGLTSAESQSLNGVWRAINKYLFDIQRYIPKVAYNEAARIRYEFPAMLGYTGRDGQARPLAQSMGDQLEAEIQFMKRRLVYMASYAGFGEFAPSIGAGRSSTGIEDLHTTFSVPVTVLPNGASPEYDFAIVPHQYMYPCFYKETATIHPHIRVAPGDVLNYTVKGLSANGYPLVVPGLNYYRSIGNVGDMSASGENFTLPVQGSRLVEFVAEPTKYYPQSGDPITKDQYLALSDKTGYSPAFRPLSASVPSENNYGAVNVRKLSLNGCVTIAHNQAMPLDLRGLKSVEDIDIKGTNIGTVLIPEVRTLATLRLPGCLTQLALEDQPGITTLEVEGAEVLTKLVVLNSPNVMGSVMLALCDSMRSADNNRELKTTQVELNNIGWDQVSTAIVRWILSVSDRGIVNLTGSIKMAQGTDQLSFSEVCRLISKFGDINDEENDLFVDYIKSNILESSLSLTGRKYVVNEDISVEGSVMWWNQLNLNVTGGNNVAVAKKQDGSYTPDVRWSVMSPEDYTTYVRFPDEFSSALQIIQKRKYQEIVVRATLTTINGATRVVQKTIGLWNRVPEVGDYAWEDGTFDKENDPSKKLVGMVVMREPEEYDEDNDISKCKLWICATANASIPVSSDGASVNVPSVNGQSFLSSWGLYPSANEGFSNATGDSADKLVTALRGALGRTDVFDTTLPNRSVNFTISPSTYQDDTNESPVQGIITDNLNQLNVIGSIGDGTGYAQRTSTGGEHDFSTEGYNKKLLEYANTVLKTVLQYNEEGFAIDFSKLPADVDPEGIPQTLQALSDLMQLIVSTAQNAGITNPARFRELLYPAVRMCSVWSPSEISGGNISEDELHSQYKRGKWMLPSLGLLCRIYNFLNNSRVTINTNSGPDISKANEDVTLKEAQRPIFANALARGRAMSIPSSGYLWSVSEVSSGNACYVNFNSGSTNGYNKGHSNVVRPVVAFTFKA